MNYGNRLQNAALVYVLEKKVGVQARTITNWGNSEVVYRIRSLRNVAGFIRKIGIDYFIKKNRIKNFKRFSDCFSNEYRTDKKYELPANKFDYLMVGSDQVWANWLTESEMRYFMLENVPTRQRIAYAASMGNPALKGTAKLVFNEEIQNFSEISVREDAAQKYVGNIIDEDVPVVLDPTMLLTAEEWLSLISRFDNQFKDKQRYIFTYFLSKPSKEMSVIMRDLKKEGYKFINFNAKMGVSRKYYSLGPEDFVFAISNSSGVLTDSFHASVFAILFAKPLYIDPNRFGGKMSARIDTLLNSMGLEANKLSVNANATNFFDTDYTDVYKRIERLREKSLNFLKDTVGE